MIKILKAMILAPTTEYFREFFLYTSCILFSVTVAFFLLGWDWVSETRSSIDLLGVLTFFAYLKATELSYKQHKNE